MCIRDSNWVGLLLCFLLYLDTRILLPCYNDNCVGYRLIRSTTLVKIQFFFIIRPHRSTTYVDAAYCYRPSSVVCRSVCHSSESCKNGWTDRDAVWVMDSDGPKESHMLDRGPQVPRDVAMATNFWLSMGQYFGCMIASDTLFDYMGRFSGSIYPTKT